MSEKWYVAERIDAVRRHRGVKRNEEMNATVDLNARRRAMLDFSRAHRARAMPAVRAFVQGVTSGNLTFKDFDDLTRYEGVVYAMKAIRRLQPLTSPRVQFSCLLYYVEKGADIRAAWADDLLVADALRVILPVYCGPALRLYRGEWAGNRARRTYGLSWSSSVRIARHFAKDGKYRHFQGGTALLETLAPADAIICAPALHYNYRGECVNGIPNFPSCGSRKFPTRV